SPLAELEIQYADYAVWQRGWLQGEVLEEQIGYWRKQLEGIEPLELPVDYARPVALSGRGASVEVRLTSMMSQELAELSRREGATVFMALLAAWQVLLNRYCGQRDVAVGSPIANRNRVETEKLIGFFVNTLALRTIVERQLSFSELLGQVREAVLASYEHQDVPFEKVVEELAPERDLGRNPLFQVVLVLQNAPEKELRLGGLALKDFEPDVESAKFELTLSLNEQQDGGLRGRLEYSADLFTSETIERMIRHWVQLVKGIIAHPEQSIGRLPLLSESERRQVSIEWNAAEAE